MKMRAFSLVFVMSVRSRRRASPITPQNLVLRAPHGSTLADIIGIKIDVHVADFYENFYCKSNLFLSEKSLLFSNIKVFEGSRKLFSKSFLFYFHPEKVRRIIYIEVKL